MKNKDMAIGILIFVALMLSISALGCSLGGGEQPKNETKLDVTEGVGIVGTLKMEELNPGLDGYLSLTVRSNLAGENTNNVYISLDNVEPFKIFECGGPQSPNNERTCTGQFDLDNNPKYQLSYRQHGMSKMFPGEELDVYWRLRAPSSSEISEIALKHPIYYDLEYTYRTSFHQNIIAMSLQEVARRRQAGESWQVAGEAGMGAGELRVNSITQQPIIYQFAHEPMGANEDPFSFTYEFNVENKGQGIPISDVVIVIQYPDGIEPAANALTEYKWKNWSALGDTNCTTDIKGHKEKCVDWINASFGDDFKLIVDPTNPAKSKILVRVIDRGDFLKQFSLQAPLQITGAELNDLRDSNMPMKVYTFKAFVVYRYFTEGKEYITVYPLRVK